VSGDFYFADQKNNKKIIAAIDCTGHGVPGAFMSMLGYSFLSQIISNKGIIQADEILNKLREYIIQALHQKQEIGYSKDGMDISLCIIDEEEKKIEFAGAYHYLLLIRNEQVTRYSGDKMPIGIHYKQKAHFSKTEISYEKGDTIYLFSDGLIDQFGGENGKKFRLKNFQDLLVTIQDESMIRQKEILEQSLDNWKSTYEQVDDILVMGIKL
jgi:serine phosphatase RsbU (regulator of sigma subunit)